ncbi:hypothetical protein PUR59_23650 [Streptomyces sp. SP18ES09]|uniref:hypothetical protein n=1 Tax=Streptomyces sp. SP18ES09 TaxID=3002532 RepID=UPI002E75B070|nr:hypothetical protein [Streptomyces sp. SP18ES09]MEE1818003.1 hypothetical protein [Streptomyces sp. SP18ES09]
MTDRPYTDDDVRAEAARQLSTLIEDPDFISVGEAMLDARVASTCSDDEEDGITWDEALNCGEFDEPQRAIHDLITSSADISDWAVNLGADGLVPYDGQLTLDGADKPFARIHFAFDAETPEEMRFALVQGVGSAIARYL